MSIKYQPGVWSVSETCVCNLRALCGIKVAQSIKPVAHHIIIEWLRRSLTPIIVALNRII